VWAVVAAVQQEVFCYMSDTLPCAQFYDPSVVDGRRHGRGGWGVLSWAGLLLGSALSMTCACMMRCVISPRRVSPEPHHLPQSPPIQLLVYPSPRAARACLSGLNTRKQLQSRFPEERRSVPGAGIASRILSSSHGQD